MTLGIVNSRADTLLLHSYTHPKGLTLVEIVMEFLGHLLAFGFDGLHEVFGLISYGFGHGKTSEGDLLVALRLVVVGEPVVGGRKVRLGKQLVEKN